MTVRILYLDGTFESFENITDSSPQEHCLLLRTANGSQVIVPYAGVKYIRENA